MNGPDGGTTPDATPPQATWDPDSSVLEVRGDLSGPRLSVLCSLLVDIAADRPFVLDLSEVPEVSTTAVAALARLRTLHAVAPITLRAGAGTPAQRVLASSGLDHQAG